MNVSFRHLVSASQVTRPDADFLMQRAAEMEKNINDSIDVLRWKILASLFYEPSTRTRFSFEAAMRRLGGQVLTADGFQFSSLIKGESIEDNTVVMAGYADVITMRHPANGSAKQAADALDLHRQRTGSEVPFINAGDGNNEHPTQALLDLYTIQKECGRLDNLHVALTGDLKNGRTVHSLAHLLSMYEGMRFTLASPQQLKMPEHVLDELRAKNIPFEEVDALEPAIDADVLYMTRVQKERFEQPEEYERLKHAFVLKAADLGDRKPVIMHPLPRVGEIATDVDPLPNAAYFRQAQNGVPVRMAILATLLGK